MFQVLEQACMRTHSQTCKEALEKAETTVSITKEEPVTETKALKDFSQPKINEIHSIIVRPTIAANTFDIKSGTIQMV